LAVSGFEDALHAYALAVEDAEYVRGLWVEAGRPAVQVTQNGMSGIHPLLKAVHECDAMANRFRGELGLTPKSAKMAQRRPQGRPVGAASADDRVPKFELRVAE
jgi:hypothetical protein